MPSKYGEVFIEKGMLTKILEKPEEELSKLINTGIYKFNPEIFDTIKLIGDAGKHDMISVLQEMIQSEKPIKAIHGYGTWMDAVYPWDILHINSLAMTSAKVGTAGTIEKNVVLKGQVSVGDESIIRSGTYIEGPVVIGKGCDVGPNTCIFPSTSIGDNVSVHPFTSIKHSIIMNDSEIGVSSIISNSIIGEGVRIGPHFVAASGEAFIHSVLGDHSLQDIGTIIGEDTSIGEGVISSPGTILGANCKISPQNKLEGEFPNRTVVV
jgi:glucose-1-phosphate thymidylyltransferase